MELDAVMSYWIDVVLWRKFGSREMDFGYQAMRPKVQGILREIDHCGECGGIYPDDRSC